MGAIVVALLLRPKNFATPRKRISTESLLVVFASTPITFLTKPMAAGKLVAKANGACD